MRCQIRHVDSRRYEIIHSFVLSKWCFQYGPIYRENLHSTDSQLYNGEWWTVAVPVFREGFVQIERCYACVVRQVRRCAVGKIACYKCANQCSHDGSSWSRIELYIVRLSVNTMGVNSNTPVGLWQRLHRKQQPALPQMWVH